MGLWGKLFGKGDPRDDEWKAVMAKAMAFLDSEELQNAGFPERFKGMLHPSAIDQVPTAFGMFGRDLNNPIPVNGPIGEVLYLSSLETATGSPVLFHRFGSIGNVDVFEIVGMDGGGWDVLYVSMYYPAKSKAVPIGLRKAAANEGSRWFRGTNNRCDDFPGGIYPLVIEASKNLVGMGLADPRIKDCAGLRATRPAPHREFLLTLRFDGTQDAAPRRNAPPSPSDEDTIATLVEIAVACAATCREAVLSTAKQFESSPKRGYWYEALCLSAFLLTFSLIRKEFRHDPTGWADKAILLMFEQVKDHRFEGEETDPIDMGRLVGLHRERYAFYWGNIKFFSREMSESEMFFYGAQIATFFTGREREGLLATVMPVMMVELLKETIDGVERLS